MQFKNQIWSHLLSVLVWDLGENESFPAFSQKELELKEDFTTLQLT